MTLLSPSALNAQELKVDTVMFLANDNSAVEKPHYDNNKQPCAMLKIYINDLPDLTFNSSLVIDKDNIKYEGGYYVVYVASGIRKLEVRHKDFSPVTIQFRDDFGISVKGGKTYRIDLSTEGANQPVVFGIRPLPHNGKLIIGNKEYEVKEGIVQLALPQGVYDYKITSDYHHDFCDTLNVEKSSETLTKKVRLKARMADVNFTCNATGAATLYVDNIKKGEPGKKTLPMGKHKIRVVAEDWMDYSATTLIDKEDFNLDVTMLPKTVISVVIKAIGFSYPKLYIDNKAVPVWENGEPIKVKRGRHLITINEAEGTRSKEKVVNIQADTGVITINGSK